MSSNPILDELHAVREHLLAEAGGTLDGLVDRLQAEELQSGRLRIRPRRINPGTAPVQPDTSKTEPQSSPQRD